MPTEWLMPQCLILCVPHDYQASFTKIDIDAKQTGLCKCMQFETDVIKDKYSAYATY